MPVATLTWTVSARHSFTIAGANPTIAELLLGIKQAIDAKSTLWVVSDYNAGNGTIEVKRGGTQTGELETVRILIFGGSAPNAAALCSPHAAGATTYIYGSMSVDANTTGPSASYASGAPYATKYVRGGSITQASAFTAASSVRVTIIEADDVFGFSVEDNSVVATFVAGRIVVKADDTLQWGYLASGASWNPNSNPASITGASTGYGISAWNGGSAGGGIARGVYWDTATAAARNFGRVISLITTTSGQSGLGESSLPSAMVPVPVGDSAQGSTSVFSFVGFLRQIRLGPIAAHRATLTSNATVQSTHIAAGSGVGLGVWFDNSQ